MISNPINQIKKIGQSIWYDDLSKELISSGNLEKLVRRGITGVTSNPSIFNKAISSGNEYDSSLNTLNKKQFNIQQIYENLTVEDIKNAADVLRPVYEKTNKKDGYVSLEVNPHFANDISATVSEAEKLFNKLNKSNVMIKVPATEKGIDCVEHLISKGINVNITLIFSLKKYEKVRNAYINGLIKRLNSGEMIENISSVASFFVSRVDSKVDPLIESNSNLSVMQKEHLLGTIAISNAILAYKDFRNDFYSDKFKKLQDHGAMIQKPLWASTSTKNPKYPNTHYVENLSMKNTINTMPEATFNLVEQRLSIKPCYSPNDALKNIQLLQNANIDLDTIAKELLNEGIKLFSDSYDELQGNISRKISNLHKDIE